MSEQCDQILRDVWTFLDDEMDETNRSKVIQHLDQCPPCLDETEVGQRLKQLLHRKCGGDVAPVVLRERLVMALRANSADRTADSEHRMGA